MSISSVVNDDVLYHIASLCHKKEALLALIITCRAAFQDFAKLLLVDDVQLRSESQLISFLSWVSKDSLHRAPFIRGLLISNIPLHHTPFSVATGERLTNLFDSLRSVLALRRLSFQDAELILDSHPNLAASISRLTTITDLTLIPAGHRCSWLLQSTLSRLKYVHLVIDDTDGRGEEVGQSSAHVLAAHSTSLLQLHWVSTWTLAIPGSPQFLNVLHLSVGPSMDPIIEDYLLAFPNLQSLKVVNLDWDDTVTMITPHRERNIGVQRRTGTWTRLRAYEGSPRSLYAFGLAFHIPELRFPDICHYLDLDALRIALEDAQPTTLAFSISKSPGRWFYNPEAVTVLSGAKTVRNLEINLCAWEEEMEIGLEPLMDAIVQILAALDRVVSFSLLLDLQLLDKLATFKQKPNRGRRPSERLTEGIDYLAFARRCTAAGKALRNVRVSQKDGRSQESDVVVHIDLQGEAS
ncbi:uncharacterized protein TRAVEDRAFT_45182 [Trametes versicolor FP-101664 SS1]|uniref:uncharacterized protein n=1 Tax=Trametes versicolor (strain FP-101664) TaxID=717944 RepID=UPI0004623CDE|nr:uncharacterized protein TRAVEDRAFT_45182 [Trametes versicolor FP-101664 SS1]EIW62361.1 hypothetical protein TRAVEDRAFT_45182 [Trametes versicolor FP-101664 SS1]